MSEPLIVTYGAGSNSTAVLIGFVERGIIPDHIVFADTGGERPETYEYIKIFSKWLIANGMPDIEITKTHLPPLYENCILKKNCHRLFMAESHVLISGKHSLLIAF